MRLILPPVLLLACAVSLPAQAAESYDNCTGFIDSVPATITTQGVWCLRADLSTAINSGDAILVAVNNVTIDCNNFKLGGLAAGPTTLATGIRSLQLNTSVRRCNVRGFLFGVNLDSAGGHLVESNRLDGNRLVGLRVEGDGSIIRDNLVVDTGGSLNSPVAIGMELYGNVRVLNNTVSGVFGADSGGPATGIIVGSGEATVRGNGVNGVVAFNGFTARGIRNTSTGRAFIRDNDLHGLGAANSIGIECASNLATAGGNFIAGFSVAVSGCTNAGNTVNPN